MPFRERHDIQTDALPQTRAKSPPGSVDETPVVHEWFTGDGTPPVVTLISWNMSKL